LVLRAHTFGHADPAQAPANPKEQNAITRSHSKQLSRSGTWLGDTFLGTLTESRQ
jgi:hypothetical protein